MSDESPKAKASIGKRILSWLLGIVCFGAAPAMIFNAWWHEAFARFWIYLFAPVIGVVLIAFWYLLFGGTPWKIRLRRFTIFIGVLIVLGVAARLLLRYEGSVDGTSLPKVTWRWAPPVSSAAEAGEETEAIDGGAVEMPEGAADFAQFMGPDRNGRVVTDGSLDWASHPPEELWRRPIGLGWSGFAVSGGRAVTQEQREGDEWVSCYELTSGALLWKHTDAALFDEKMSGPGPRSTPTVVDGKVWTLGATGILNCLDLESGELLWTRQMLNETGSMNLEWGKSTSPLHFDGKVVVSGGMDRATLVAVDASSGETVWTYDGDGASYSSPVLATIAGERQIVSVNRLDVTGHDPETGEELWHWEWPGVFPKVCQPEIVGDNRVLLTASYGLGSHLLEIARTAEGWSASRLWESDRMKTKFSSSTVVDDYAYGLHEGIFACMAMDDGAKVWKGGRYGFGQHLLVNGDTFLVQTERGPVVLVAATPEEHRELCRVDGLADSGGTGWNPPVLAGRYLVLRNDREAVCYRLAE